MLRSMLCKVETSSISSREVHNTQCVIQGKLVTLWSEEVRSN